MGGIIRLGDNLTEIEKTELIAKEFGFNPQDRPGSVGLERRK